MRSRGPRIAFLFRSRVVRVLLVGFQALFLNVIAPGHTRGIITLGGKSSLTCCQTRSEPSKAPTPKDKASCAICYVVARFAPPPVVDFRLTELGLRDVMPLAPPQRIVSHQAPLTYDGRAPPADCSIF